MSNDFYHLREIYQTDLKKQSLDAGAKIGLDALKTASKKVGHKSS